MPRLVVSTVGTSLLTNQIDVYTDPEEYFIHIQESANDTEEEIDAQVKKTILELKARAENKLYTSNKTTEIRQASAELNGIYGLYDRNIEQGKLDIHWLIATDTYQGKITAEIVQEFLVNKGIKTHIQTPKTLSIVNTEKFSYGIDAFLEWWDAIFLAYKDSHHIYFNLAGGFKALQGYANTIGMLYGAEIIYIFEGNLDFITIPKLPIEIDYSVIKPTQFALMASSVDIWIKLSDLENVPDSLIFKAGDEAKLNNWGNLLWNRCKRKFFTGDIPIVFPRLFYDKSFLKDYTRNIVNEQNKVDLHDVLADISASMIKFNGNTTRFDSRLHFTRYEGGQKCEGGIRKNQIDHFYIKNTGWRVSCIVKDGNLYLRHYGEHDYVNDNP